MRPPASELTDPAPPAPSPRRGHALAVLVLIASLTLVALYWRNAQQRELRAAEADFIAHTTEVAEELQQRLSAYQLVSRGAVSLFASLQQPSAGQWQGYVTGLKIERQFPSLLGLGFAAYLDRMRLQDLQLAMRDSGRGFFTVTPKGAREYYGPVIYLEPRTPDNVMAIGYDMLAEPVRAAAMLAARDAGESRLTGAVHLEHDPGSARGGLLLYSPVYRNAVVPASASARRDALQGWVYAPIRIGRFVDIALGARKDQFGLRIVDTTDGEQVLYAPMRRGNAATTGDIRFAHSATLEAFGRRWRLEFDADQQATLAQRRSDLRTTLAVGALASLLLFWIAITMARTESHAQAMAARMSESYRRSELRFRSAMEYSAIGQALLDRAGTIADVNPALVALFGSTRERLPGTPFGSHFVHGDGEAIRTREMEVLADGVYQTTRQLLRPNHELRDVQLTFAPVPGDIGQDIARLVQVEDITERVRAEARIHALNRSLEARVAVRTRELTQANQELESFAYNVSHDLRAPLRAIDGFARLLGERHAPGLDASGHDYLARIRNAAGRMDALIGSLLKISRLARAEPNLVPLDLSELAAEIAAELRAEQPDRTVEVLIEPGLRAAGDAPLVRDLLQNLLGNAWKFTGEVANARIEFAAEPVTARAEGMPGFFVRDNGAGFAQEYADKLFRPFQRLHSQEQFAGDGIGLASVKRIVERHGGTIHAEGSPGEGATFHFTLPAVEGNLG